MPIRRLPLSGAWPGRLARGLRLTVGIPEGLGHLGKVAYQLWLVPR